MIFLLRKQVILMNSFWIILFHTYLNKLKTKSFIITTVLSVVIVLAITNINNIIDLFDKNGGKEKVAVIDQSGQLYEPYKQQIKNVNKDIQLTFYKGSEEQAERLIEKGEFAGVIHL